ncbi:AAA family ATPase [Chryseobacterium aurantiacum]|uniref:AAA family ATPase n=1 Tax=Chryseobacterium aurantiacum TaxID=2116499 RepID=UPI000D133AA0|nr:AAA family ATPase [Chryseobacterium aurantiacum]
MLIRFNIENFRSFNERVFFSLLPGKGTLKSHHKTKQVGGIATLKTAVLYGANASGKTNLIKAIEFGKQLILKGSSIDDIIDFNAFKLDVNNVETNSRIEYEIQHKNKNYAYGFIFNSKEIVEEWLFEISKKSEKKIFSRDKNDENEYDLLAILNKNKKADDKQFLEFIAKGTPKNQLFLTEIRSRKVKENVTDINDLLNVIDWFQNALTVIFPNSKSIGKKFELLDDINLNLLFTEMLDYFDTGIDGIEFKDVEIDKIDVPDSIIKDIENDLLSEKSEKRNAFISNVQEDKYYAISITKNGILKAQVLKTKHKKIGGGYELFDLKDESDGTRRIMDLIPLIIDFFKGDNVFVIDEIERSLHPNLIYDLFDFFLSKCKNVNSQIIVASHESTLLTQKLLRKDEIWFVFKDMNGASRLYSLEDYSVRFDKEIRKDYLFGRYKGVPKFGNRDNLTVLPKN